MKGSGYLVAIFVGLFAGLDGIFMSDIVSPHLAGWSFGLGCLNLCVAFAGIVLLILANRTSKSDGDPHE